MAFASQGIGEESAKARAGTCDENHLLGIHDHLSFWRYCMNFEAVIHVVDENILAERNGTLTAAPGCANDLEVSRWRLAVRVKCIDLAAFHPDSPVNYFRRLLVIPFGQLRRNRRQITKQPSRAVVRPGREVHLCGGRGGGLPCCPAAIFTGWWTSSIDMQTTDPGF